MRIAGTDVWLVETPATGRTPNRYGTVTRLKRAIIRLRDEDGNEGWGESVPLEYFTGETAAGSAAILREAGARLEALAGGDPLASIGDLADFKRQPAARSGLETAILDLMGNRSGRPLSDWLGGEKRGELSMDCPLGLLSREEAAEKIRRFLGSGVSTFKLKVGMDAENDAERVLGIRKEFRDEVRLRIDANGGFSSGEALRFCAEIGDSAVEHFEQPVSPDEEKCLETFRKIRAMGIQVAVDESLFTPEDARRLIEEDAADVAVIKLIKCGGPLAAREIAGIFTGAGKAAVLSSPYESFIAKAAGAAVALSMDDDGRAQELDHMVAESDFAEWRHRLSEGKLYRGEGTGHGARGLRERLDALSSPAS
ncbi:MAG: enolase C-terminal domain-like protein [bacterium]